MCACARVCVSCNRINRHTQPRAVVGLQLAIEPQVNVDDGDALELGELSEEGRGRPLLLRRQHQLQRVHRHGGDVVVPRGQGSGLLHTTTITTAPYLVCFLNPFTHQPKKKSTRFPRSSL